MALRIMAQTSSRSPRAGGVLIALGAIGGTVAGVVVRQVSAGFLIGAALGVALALAVWLRDRARHR